MHPPLHYSIMVTRQENRDSIACTVFNVGPAGSPMFGRAAAEDRL
jgi:hypothetical protein